VGLAINSSFSGIAFGASSSMKSQQGIMGSSIKKISTGKKYAGGGLGVTSTMIKKAAINKVDAAKYEAQYNTLQTKISDVARDAGMLESALDIAVAFEADTAAGGAASANLKDELNAVGSTNKLSGGVSWVVADATITGAFAGGSVTSGDGASTIGGKLASAYADLTAADYASTALQNLAAAAQEAYSSVADTDIAMEMSRYVKANVMSQASQAMVAQANQSMATMLNLLQ
jgi:flagellin